MRITVLGGGPAGMMAAITAAENGASVDLIEQNGILGKKLLITGKGRCNVTNAADRDELMRNVIRNPKFLYSAFFAFDSHKCIRFFEECGVPLKTERGNRVFPVSDSAADIRNALRDRMRRAGVRVIRDRVNALQTAPFVLIGERNYTADRVILASGGRSYPATGSTGDGYRFASETGHRVVPQEPALVALRAAGDLPAKLEGLSLKNVRLTLKDYKGKSLYTGFGEMLFTRTGISGPLVLSASSFFHISDLPATTEIDLKPALDDKTLDARLLRDFEKNLNRDFKNAFDALLPRKIISAVIEKSGIDPAEKVRLITREERRRLAAVIKCFSLEITGKCGFEEAVVTAGGVDVRDVDPRTMESRLVPGLYFAGEILDVDAFTGGFNLQIAFSTGFLAGRSAATEG